MGSSPNDFSSPCDTNNYADVAPIATTFRRRGGVERLCIYSDTHFFVFLRCEDRNEISATMRTTPTIRPETGYLGAVGRFYMYREI